MCGTVYHRVTLLWWDFKQIYLNMSDVTISPLIREKFEEDPDLLEYEMVFQYDDEPSYDAPGM